MPSFRDLNPAHHEVPIVPIRHHVMPLSDHFVYTLHFQRPAQHVSHIRRRVMTHSHRFMYNLHVQICFVDKYIRHHKDALFVAPSTCSKYEVPSVPIRHHVMPLSDHCVYTLHVQRPAQQVSYIRHHVIFISPRFVSMYTYKDMFC